MSHRGEEEYWRKVRRRRSCRKTDMERFGCQKTHLKWKCLRRKEKKFKMLLS
jgi:hypothetical protein